MRVRVDNEPSRVDDETLLGETGFLFGTKRFIHAPADATFGGDDAMPGKGGGFLFVEAGEKISDVARIDVEVRRDRSVGGKATLGNEGNDPENFGADFQKGR